MFKGWGKEKVDRGIQGGQRGGPRPNRPAPDRFLSPGLEAVSVSAHLFLFKFS